MRKFIFAIIFVLTSFFLFSPVYGDEGINITVKNNGVDVYSGVVPFPLEGDVDINDTSGDPHPINARSVLSIITLADDMSSEFNISTLIYYPSFSAFYLQCITVDSVELCDNWIFKVNGEGPANGMDQEILSGGENISLFFGSEDLPEPEIIDDEPEVVEDEPEVIQTSSKNSSGSRSKNIKSKEEVIKEEVVVEEPKEVEIVKEVIKEVSPQVVRVVCDVNVTLTKEDIAEMTGEVVIPEPIKNDNFLKRFWDGLFN